MLSFASLLCVSVITLSAPGPVPVILDTDIGDDIDDTWALAMMLGLDEIDLKLITVACDDTPAKARLAAKFLDRSGRTMIPIGIGVKTSDKPLNQQAWLGEYALTTYPGVIHEDGIQAMIDAIHASPQPVTLVVIGPQTNIAEALRRDPSIAQKARVVTMAGSVRMGYNGAPEPCPEYNVFRDVKAAQVVFAAPWEIIMNPLDVCGTLRLEGERYAKVRDSAEDRAVALIENYNAWTHRKEHPEGASSILFDTVAVYLAFDTAFCGMERVKLSVDEKGNTVLDEAGRPVQCALSWKDRDAFEELLVRSLTRRRIPQAEVIPIPVESLIQKKPAR